MKTNKLRISGKMYLELQHHLFPGDNLEAVAFALCNLLEFEDERVFTVSSIFKYPYNKCSIREVDRVEWSPAEIVELFEQCRKNNLFLLKIHCHPKHWPFFSDTDNISDFELSETLIGWTNRNDDVLSLIMLPNNNLMGRLINSDGKFIPLDNIIVVGDDIACHYEDLTITQCEHDHDVQLRTRQAFGEGTTKLLRKLKIGIVGCSGTGSAVAEMLARLGVGKLVLVDDDKVEFKNLNRIINSSVNDAKMQRHKVEVLKDAIARMGTDVEVLTLPSKLHSLNAYKAIASCDIVFGCMDTIDGRYLLNRIASYFCSAYFDIGVRLDADGKGNIQEILGRIDYLQPGGSSLLSRGRYTMEQLKSADLARVSPEEYARQLKEGYIKSANVVSPAVISVNLLFSSHAVTELLARLHPFRDLPNSRYASITYSLSGGMLICEDDGIIDEELKRRVGQGDKKPILDSPTLILTSE